ncbi:hypothetical protein G9A89_014195 [Geosiphon pyriformis]|nr:hypothetical protein G9A89_014195 [Geosiphon pyriformis]
MPHWFVLTSKFLNDKSFIKSVLNGLHEIWSGNFEVYTNGLLKNAGSAGIMSGAAAYFLVLNMGVGIGVKGHFGMASNIKTNTLANEAAGSPVFLSVGMQK